VEDIILPRNPSVEIKVPPPVVCGVDGGLVALPAARVKKTLLQKSPLEKEFLDVPNVLKAAKRSTSFDPTQVLANGEIAIRPQNLAA